MKKLLAGLAFLLLAACGSVPQVTAPVKDTLAVIHLDGEINQLTAVAFRKDVDAVLADKNVGAVLLQVNSPGGDVYASSLMYDDLARLHVPVVAYCNELCASGAVYAMQSPSVQKVYVNRATIIGSVGVFSIRQRQDKPDNIDIYKSGKYKLAGVLTKKEDGEDDYIQHQIMVMANTFYDLVKANRGPKISDESWVHIKNAEIFIGKEGVQRGLADGVVSVDAIYQMMQQYVGKNYDLKDIKHEESPAA